ncbi:MAG: FMN-binding negative transcriptional regulator [Ilumatobacter sp.]|uniref:FMN-binding negative transcriptional regulator n=1 Tax=Ilumatobacter sp. TaxID=1967498 RepID=UPI00262B7A80|nr:FMN-binding negative transcriptional regulator [Ilumatobacter sp.]MDJ0770206.1 FMN-binding negative transcriptional regulator [Ilumatobacter sp.]
MFRSRHFAEDDAGTMVAMARAAGFGHLVVAGEEGLASTPVPFLIDDEGEVVRAHLARPNPVWRVAPCDALLIVPVTDTYVTPSWYPSKAEHGKVVPTWNYEIVHLHGTLVARDDDAWIEQMVRDLTDHHEAAFDRPWPVDDAPADYLTKMRKAIVGVELTVTRLDGKRKLSQNKNEDDLAGTIAGLAGSPVRGAAAVRAAMIDDGTGTADGR